MLLLEINQKIIRINPAALKYTAVDKKDTSGLISIIEKHPILKHLIKDTTYVFPYNGYMADKKLQDRSELAGENFINGFELVDKYFLRAKPFITGIEEEKLFDISAELLYVGQKGVVTIYEKEAEINREKEPYNLNRFNLFVAYQNFLNGHIGHLEKNRVRIVSPQLRMHFVDLFVRLYYFYRLPPDNWFFAQNQSMIFEIINKRILKGHYVQNDLADNSGKQYPNKQAQEVFFLFIFATFNIAKTLRFDLEELQMSPDRGERDFIMVLGENYKQVLEDESKLKWGENYQKNIGGLMTRLNLSGYKTKTIRTLERDYSRDADQLEQQEIEDNKKEIIAVKPDVDSFLRRCALIADKEKDEDIYNIFDDDFEEEVKKVYETEQGKKIVNFLKYLQKTEELNKKILYTSVILKEYKELSKKIIQDSTSSLKFKNIVYNEKKAIIAHVKEQLIQDIFAATRYGTDFTTYIEEEIKEHNEIMEKKVDVFGEEMSEEETREYVIESRKDIIREFQKNILQVVPDLFGNIPVERFGAGFINTFKKLFTIEYTTDEGQSVKIPLPGLDKDEEYFLYSSSGLDSYKGIRETQTAERTFDELLGGKTDFRNDAAERPRRRYLNFNSKDEYQTYKYKLELVINFIDGFDKEPSRRELVSGESSLLQDLKAVQAVVEKNNYFDEYQKIFINKIYNSLFVAKSGLASMQSLPDLFASVSTVGKRANNILNQERKKEEIAKEQIKLSALNIEENLRIIMGSFVNPKFTMPENVEDVANAMGHIANNFFGYHQFLENGENNEYSNKLENIVNIIDEIIPAGEKERELAWVNIQNICLKYLASVKNQSDKLSICKFAMVLSSIFTLDVNKTISDSLERSSSKSFRESLQRFIESGEFGDATIEDTDRKFIKFDGQKEPVKLSEPSDEEKEMVSNSEPLVPKDMGREFSEEPEDEDEDQDEESITQEIEPEVVEPVVEPAQEIEPVVEPTQEIEPVVEPTQEIEPVVEPTQEIEPEPAVEPTQEIKPKNPRSPRGPKKSKKATTERFAPGIEDVPFADSDARVSDSSTINLPDIEPIKKMSFEDFFKKTEAEIAKIRKTEDEDEAEEIIKELSKEITKSLREDYNKNDDEIEDIKLKLFID